MIKIFGVWLLVSACFRPVYGQEKKPAAPAIGDIIKQLERDWTDAEKAQDIGKLSQIVADDWSGLSYDGVRTTKQQMLDDIKSGAMKVGTVEFGPMDVKVIGTVAVIQGSDTEKSSMNGKDTTGKWVWMDVFVKRNGKWQVVRSQSAVMK